MHSSETSHDETRLCVEHNPLHPAFWDSFAGTSDRKSEPLGRLDGATLTERVTRFLERYDDLLYAFR